MHSLQIQSQIQENRIKAVKKDGNADTQSRSSFKIILEILFVIVTFIYKLIQFTHNYWIAKHLSKILLYQQNYLFETTIYIYIGNNLQSKEQKLKPTIH